MSDQVWGAKVNQETNDLLDELFGKSGFQYKKEYLEHLARLDKLNNIRKGAEGHLPPELLKLNSGDLTELFGYTDGINKLYLRLMERSGLREAGLNNDLIKTIEESERKINQIQEQYAVISEKAAMLDHNLHELQKHNVLLQKENELIDQERNHHAEAIRIKEETIANLQADILEKYKRFSELNERLKDYETLTEENTSLLEQLKDLKIDLREQKKDEEIRVQRIDSEHQLVLTNKIQEINSAASVEISKYRDELTSQLRAVVEQRSAAEEQAQKRIDEYRQETKELRSEVECIRKENEALKAKRTRKTKNTNEE